MLTYLTACHVSMLAQGVNMPVSTFALSQPNQVMGWTHLFTCVLCFTTTIRQLVARA